MDRSTWIIFIVVVLAVAGSVLAFYFMDGNSSPTGTCFMDNGTKSYVVMGAEQCKAAKFACAEGKEYFADSCGCGCAPSEEPTTGGKLVPHYCTPESKEVEACTQEYQPVCAWYDPAIVQCIKYPCAINMGNKCNACATPNVLYYTEGECPTGNGAQA